MISVLIPVYNTEQYLLRCLNSVLNGVYKDIEVICVNDGSTDNSKEILEEICRKDRRVKVFHTVNRGLPAARARALQESKGEYIAFIDSDDYVHFRYFEEMYDCAKKYDADVVYCACRRFTTESLSDSDTVEKPKKVDFGNMSRGNYFRNYVWGRLYKKNILKKGFFGENMDFQDSIFNMCNVGVLKDPIIYYIKTPMYYYYRRAGSRSSMDDFDDRLFNTINWIYHGKPDERNHLLYYQGLKWALHYRWYLMLKKDKFGIEDMNKKLAYFRYQIDDFSQIRFHQKLFYSILIACPKLYELIRISLDRSMLKWKKNVSQMESKKR